MGIRSTFHPTTRHLVESLRSDQCPACASGKHPGRTLCGRCFRKLPGEVRDDLYKRIGQGYEAAVAAAMTALKKSAFLLPTKLEELF